MDRTARIGKLSDNSVETGSRDRAGGTGQLERTAGIGQWWQDSHGSRTDGTEKPRQDNHSGTARKGKLGQERGNRTTYPGQTRNLDRTSRTGHPGRVSLKRSTWQISLNRAERTGWQ
jgi:hypothetical protein